jgi:hypothetical protein
MPILFCLTTWLVPLAAKDLLTYTLGVLAIVTGLGGEVQVAGLAAKRRCIDLVEAALRISKDTDPQQYARFLEMIVGRAIDGALK